MCGIAGQFLHSPHPCREDSSALGPQCVIAVQMTKAPTAHRTSVWCNVASAFAI